MRTTTERTSSAAAFVITAGSRRVGLHPFIAYRCSPSPHRSSHPSRLRRSPPLSGRRLWPLRSFASIVAAISRLATIASCC